jgi:hypothetical protein
MCGTAVHQLHPRSGAAVGRNKPTRKRQVCPHVGWPVSVSQTAKGKPPYKGDAFTLASNSRRIEECSQSCLLLNHLLASSAELAASRLAVLITSWLAALSLLPLGQLILKLKTKNKVEECHWPIHL